MQSRESNSMLELDQEQSESMADGLSGVVGARLTVFLGSYVMEKNLGWVFNADTDFILPNIGKRRPDLAFCSFTTLPEPPRTGVPIPPDLAIEITSSRDEIDDSDKKLKEYRQAKVRLIWIIRPVAEVVEVYRADGTTALLTTNDLLRGEGVVPGFELPLSRLFTLPKPG